MNVRKRTITRFYALHRGFASKRDAYRAIAKREVDQEIWVLTSRKARILCPGWLDLSFDAWNTIRREAKLQVLAEEFPRGCGKPNIGRPLRPMQHTPKDQWSKPFCNGCRWDRMDAVAKRLQEEDEGLRRSELSLFLLRRSAYHEFL